MICNEKIKFDLENFLFHDELKELEKIKDSDKALILKLKQEYEELRTKRCKLIAFMKNNVIKITSERFIDLQKQNNIMREYESILIKRIKTISEENEIEAVSKFGLIYGVNVNLL